MAKGNASRMRVSNPTYTPPLNAQSVQNIQQAIDRHWEHMPKQAKTFLLRAPDVGFHVFEALAIGLQELAQFWSSPSVIEYTRGIGLAVRAGSACGASWSIALNYLKLGKVHEARILTLNGSFLHQCSSTPIETIIEMCAPNSNTPIKHFSFPLFRRGLNTTRTPQTMKAYLQSSSKECHRSTISTGNLMKCVGQIGDDWSESSLKRSHQKPSSKVSEGTQIQLILVDNTNENKRRSFNIGSSTTLKSLFNDYAGDRGVSLRSLRFSYDGKTLFLSSVGSQTPNELNMQDQDVITVHDTNNLSEETSSSRSNQTDNVTPKIAKTTKNSSNRTKGKGKKERNKLETPFTPLAEYKAQHFKILSKLHEEIKPRLKEIRTRLNALDLERQPPKQRETNNKKKRVKANVDLQILPNSVVGGKAGRPHFIVQVGEVQHFYKTTKPSVLSSQYSPSSASTLDVHGFTREEALIQLDESLKVWVDTAMHGSYPFVIRAMIVCGCGNQILSETVEKWIKSTGNVCNAPKNSIPRNK